MRSLRARLVLLTVAVAVIAVGGVVLLSRFAVRLEYTRLETRDRDRRLPGVAAVLGSAIGPDTTRAEVDARLAAVAEPLGHRLVLLAADGGVRGISSPSLSSASFRATGSGLTVTQDDGAGRVRTMMLRTAETSPI